MKQRWVSNIKPTINRQVWNVTDLYGVYEMVRHKLGYSELANRSSRRALLGSFEDTPGYADDADATKNIGWKERADYISGSQI